MSLSARVRTEVLLTGPCAYCGDPIPTQVDHVMPLSRGGTDDWDNLAPACRGCNMEKLDFTPEEYRAYREEEGLGWPPESGFDFIKRTVAKLQAQHPDVDVRAAITRSLNRHSPSRSTT